MAASQTEKPAGYRVVKTSSLVFWPSTDAMQASIIAFVSMGRRS